MKISLKSARVNAGVSQVEAAKLVGVSTKTIGEWENFKAEPKSSQGLKLAKLYGVPMDKIKFSKDKKGEDVLINFDFFFDKRIENMEKEDPTKKSVLIYFKLALMCGNNNGVAKSSTDGVSVEEEICNELKTTPAELEKAFELFKKHNLIKINDGEIFVSVFGELVKGGACRG